MTVINTEKVPIFMYCENAEEGAIQQAKDVANHPAVFRHVAIMPDTHQGYGMPIGGVCALENAISPNMVGVDIACGMLAFKTDLNVNDFTPEELQEFLITTMRYVRKNIPMGFKHQPSGETCKKQAEELLSKFKNLSNNINEDTVAGQLGTLGGGNHFVEIQKDEGGNIWCMIHSGSRNIGKKTCDKYNKIALALNEKYHSPIPNKHLAFLPADSEEGQAYINHMNFCMDFSYENRRIMMDRVVGGIQLTLGKHIWVEDPINIHHNYASLEHHFGRDVWVHRKGATLAREKTVGIIPGSMGTSSYIVQGKGNEQSFCSCSHGAGRTMSRTKAKETLSLDKFGEIMKDVVFHCDKEHLDESPMAYKNIDEVMEQQKELITIKTKLTPLAVEKG